MKSRQRKFYIMKKILVALMLSIISITSFSQIQVQKSSLETRDVVKAMGTYYSATIIESKYEGNIEYYIRTSTTNQFDQRFFLLLGYNESEVKESLDALCQMAGATKGDSFTIDAETTASVASKGSLWIKKKGYAGYAILTKKQIEKFINFYAEGGGH